MAGFFRKLMPKRFRRDGVTIPAIRLHGRGNRRAVRDRGDRGGFCGLVDSDFCGPGGEGARRRICCGRLAGLHCRGPNRLLRCPVYENHRRTAQP